MTRKKTVADLRDGEEATIVDIRGPESIRTRLMEMGLVRGTRLRMLGRAPLGDPLEVKVRGTALALRRQEARQILVTQATPQAHPSK